VLAVSSLLDDIRSVLSEAGFDVLSPRGDEDTLYFEDASLMGHVRVLPSPDEIVQQWEGIQDAFLGANAPSFLRDATKAWNLYTVLLTSAPVATFASRLFEIEEDFRGTRKIARADVVSRVDLVVALGPLLPIQNSIRVLNRDTKQELLDRLAALSPELRLIGTDASPEAIVLALTESK
jgi:hypothetical protein